jgi:hypothetical protein
MKEIRIEDISTLMEAIDGYPYGKWIFRGQADATWKLEPSINRYVDRMSLIKYAHNPLLGKEKLEWRKKMRNFELELFEEYVQSHTTGNDLAQEEDLLETLVDLQHYGAPTGDVPAIVKFR